MEGSLFDASGPGRPLTLRGLTELTGRAVNMAPGLHGVWVTAELSDLRTSGGHYYTELVEKDGRGMVVAKMRANIWAGTARTVLGKFRAATGRELSTGLKVMLQGSVTFHNVYGMSFNVSDIDPSYTLGDIERRRREILEALHKAGVLERNRSLAMAPDCQRIAVISASGAAGYGDFINQLNANPYGYVFYPCLFEAVMQGERTSASVCDAFERIEMALDLFDCVAILRGGGATTDLIGFDDYAIGMAIANCPLPVISAIGHERDTTLPDYVANVSCKTPTAAANFLIDRLHGADLHMMGVVNSIALFARQSVEGEQRRLASITSALPAFASALVGKAEAELRHAAGLLPSVAGNRLRQERQRIDALAVNALSLSRAHLTRQGEWLDRAATDLRRLTADTIARQRELLERQTQMVEALSPAATLRRGYSITRVEGHAVTDPTAVGAGQTIVTTLAKGELISYKKD